MGVRGCVWPFVLAIPLASAATSLVSAGEAESQVVADAIAAHVRLKGAPGAAVRRAAHGAQLRLAEPACKQVLSEFADTSGHLLQQRLDDMGMTANDYVGSVIFVEGSNQSACASGGVLGGTQPGSRVVALCGSAFADTERRNARLAEAIVIHEVLHTLGLGENPPSSQEITSRVLQGCQERKAIAAAKRP